MTQDSTKIIKDKYVLCINYYHLKMFEINIEITSKKGSTNFSHRVANFCPISWLNNLLKSSSSQKVQGELDEKKPHYMMLCEASAREVPELEEPVCFELEAKTDKMKKLWNEVR